METNNPQNNFELPWTVGDQQGTLIQKRFRHFPVFPDFGWHGFSPVCYRGHLVLQRHVRQLSMSQVIIFQELKSFLRISIRTWLMDQSPCETSHFLAIGVLTQRCSTRGADQGAKAETAGESSTGRARRRGGLCGDPIEKRRPAPGLRKVGQAGRVRDTGHEQGRNWRGSSGWRLLRSLPTRRPMEGNLDRVGGTGG